MTTFSCYGSFADINLNYSVCFLQILKMLNSNTENPYLIWDNATRAELGEFLESEQLRKIKTVNYLTICLFIVTPGLHSAKFAVTDSSTSKQYPKVFSFYFLTVFLESRSKIFSNKASQEII